MPAYNEEESLRIVLPKIIEYIKQNNYELIIINDGSTDNTLSVLHQYNINENRFLIINNKVNLGYGGAIKKGLEKASGEYIVTIDADGQHALDDIQELLNYAIKNDADLIIGARKLRKGTMGVTNYYREFGKFLIKIFAKILIPNKITDLNSGFKLYKGSLVKTYFKICPDNMAFSDIITLIFLNQKHLILEKEISVLNRISGKSKISTLTAFETIIEIFNIITLFNPLKIFLPLTLLLTSMGILWGLPILLMGRGLSIGSLLLILMGILNFMLGLICEQISKLKKMYLGLN